VRSVQAAHQISPQLTRDVAHIFELRDELGVKLDGAAWSRL